MKHFRVSLATILAVVLVGSLFLINGCKKKEPEVIKIGAILPPTGNLSSYGVDSRKALELAVEKLNKTGGIDGRLISLIIEDSQGNPK